MDFSPRERNRMADELQTNYLNDYRPPGYLVDSITLHVELSPEKTRVRARSDLLISKIKQALFQNCSDDSKSQGLPFAMWYRIEVS